MCIRDRVNASQIYNSSVGYDTHVGPFAYIRPGSNVGNCVRVGDFVEIKNSNVSDGTKISNLTYVGDSDVGKNVKMCIRDRQRTEAREQERRRHVKAGQDRDQNRRAEHREHVLEAQDEHSARTELSCIIDEMCIRDSPYGHPGKFSKFAALPVFRRGCSFFLQ